MLQGHLLDDRGGFTSYGLALAPLSPAVFLTAEQSLLGREEQLAEGGEAAVYDRFALKNELKLKKSPWKYNLSEKQELHVAGPRTWL